MTSTRKRTPALEAAHPSATADDATTARETGSAAPSVDPGPPPRPPYATSEVNPSLAHVLLEAARTGDRTVLRGISTLTHGAAAANYKAELMQWMDDLEAHAQAFNSGFRD